MKNIVYIVIIAIIGFLTGYYVDHKEKAVVEQNISVPTDTIIKEATIKNEEIDKKSSYLCKGVTKKGLPCKRKISSGEYCFQHK